MAYYFTSEGSNQHSEEVIILIWISNENEYRQPESRINCDQVILRKVK
jgi:hypothetical protein